LLWAFYAPHRQEVRSFLEILFFTANARECENHTILDHTNRELWQSQAIERKSPNLPKITCRTRLKLKRFMQLESPLGRLGVYQSHVLRQAVG
jgi:hypothetical protein